MLSKHVPLLGFIHSDWQSGNVPGSLSKSVTARATAPEAVLDVTTEEHNPKDASHIITLQAGTVRAKLALAQHLK